MISFAAFEPSRSPFNTSSSTFALNVRPRADGWGPMPSLTPYTQALPGECLGAVYTRNSDGIISIFAGTKTALYRFNTGTLAWDDISRTTGGPYNVPDGDNWCFTYYGRSLGATNIANEPQIFDTEAGLTFANLAGSPPKAKFCWVAGDFFVLGHLDGFPERVQWSGLNNVEHWTVGEQGADYQTFPDGGEVQGGITDRLGAFVMQRDSIRYMQFDSASNYTFTFQAVNPKRGAVSPLSIVQIGPQDFLYLSEDGFFRGAAGTPIGAEVVDSWFLGDELDVDAISLVQGVSDPYEKIVWWKYRTQVGTQRLIGYDWQLGRWCYSDAPVGYLMSTLTPGLTWDALSTFYGSIDAVVEPFDSRFFKGGRPSFSAFGLDNRLGFFTGLSLEATIETATMELSPGQRSFVYGLRVVTDAPTVSVAVGTADYHGGAVSWKAANSGSSVTGVLPARANGKLHRFRATIPAGTDWDYLHGIDPMVRSGGRR